MNEFILTGIGKNIKTIRLKSGKKLTTLAKEADISKGLLSKIENGRTLPSLPVFLSIVRALGISPKEFFKDLDFEPPQRYIHKSAQDCIPIKKEVEAHGFNYQFILERAFENFTLEVVILEIAPNSKRKKVQTDAYELKYVIEGEIDYQIDDEIIPLQKGDVLLYNGNIPHVPHNRTDKMAKMLVIYFFYNKE